MVHPNSCMYANIECNTKTTYDGLRQMVKEILSEEDAHVIRFSIFEDDRSVKNEGQWPILIPDILSDKPVFEGTCQFVVDYWRVTDEPIYSPTLHNPTWKDIIIAANNLLKNGDGCGVFLEGFWGPVNGKQGLYRLVIGS